VLVNLAEDRRVVVLVLVDVVLFVLPGVAVVVVVVVVVGVVIICLDFYLTACEILQIDIDEDRRNNVYCTHSSSTKEEDGRDDR
jgi:Na+/glutamate symporter